jgi:hypothetical protein
MVTVTLPSSLAGSNIPIYLVSNGAGAPFSGSPEGSNHFGSATSNAVQVPVTPCTPTVSSVQVSGQATNTIIAGTNGSISIYGSCLGGATSVQSDGSGLQFGPVSYTADGRVDVSFQTSSSASGGAHNVTVSTANGTNGASSAAQVFATSVSLQSFSFTNSVQYLRDCSTVFALIDQPTWPSGAIRCRQASNFAGDHAVYASGKTMQGTAVFALDPVPSQGVPGVYVQGTTAGYGTFTPTGSVSIQGGTATFSAPVSSDTAFAARQTQFINPLNINWSVAQTGASCAGGCVAAGASSNPVYVTLADSVLPQFLPANTTNPNPVMLTYVKLAVGNGGAYNQATALANTWAQFSTGNGPANVTTWDDRSMQYYTAGFPSCAFTAQTIVENVDPNGAYSPSAQCGAFELLLESALAMNGIHSNRLTVTAAYQPTGPAEWSKLVIKNWCFIGTTGCPPGTPTYPTEPDWKYQLRLNLPDYMVPTPAGGYGLDLTNLQGIQGQGENGTTTPPYTPLEKVFDSHFIAQIPTLDGAPTAGNQYYDPSYGVTYPSEAGFESQAVAGYAYEFFVDLGTGVNHVFTPIAGSPNIRFDVFLPFSM